MEWVVLSGHLESIGSGEGEDPTLTTGGWSVSEGERLMVIKFQVGVTERWGPGSSGCLPVNTGILLHCRTDFEGSRVVLNYILGPVRRLSTYAWSGS